MRIFIIRHGETTSDIDNLYGGDYDDHLTEKGVKQAEELAQKLANHGIQIIFSSSRIRARETSDILKRTLNIDVEVVDEIRERNGYGILTGTSKDEAKVNHPELVEQLKDYRNAIEGAEDYNSFTERVAKGFEHISNSKYDTVAVVTHGGPIRCLFRSVLKFGELSDKLADCAVIELEKNGLNFKVVKTEGTTLVTAVYKN